MFDFAAYKRAMERKDVAAWLQFYAEDAVWTEYRPSAPPHAPRVMRGREEIARYLEWIATTPAALELSHEVVGEDRAAFRVTGELGEDRRIIEHCIVDLRGETIVRQSDVEAWD
jgi:ketosteroid isomerase-like protein